MILKEVKNNEIYEILTASEQNVAEYICKYPDKVLKMTSRELAEKIFVSAPTIIRFCKKLGYESFAEFKMELSKETTDEYQKMLDVDSNFPFSKESTPEEAVNRLATIAISNIMKLRDSFDYKTLDKVCNLLQKKHYIDIYGEGLSIKCASEFREKMMRIGYHVTLVDEDLQAAYWTNNSQEGQCAILISYSGKTKVMVEAIKTLRRRKAKIILITGNQNSEMVKDADMICYIQANEELEMRKKIDSFGVMYNIHYILDCIYVGLFLKDYDENYEKAKKFRELPSYFEKK